MSDIDFDELDRAVTSLMQKRAEKEAAQQTAATDADGESTSPAPDADKDAAPGATAPQSSQSTVGISPLQSATSITTSTAQSEPIAQPATPVASPAPQPELTNQPPISSSVGPTAPAGSTPQPVAERPTVESSSSLVTPPVEPSSSAAPSPASSPTPPASVATPSPSIPPLVIEPLTTASTTTAPTVAVSTPTPNSTDTNNSPISAKPAQTPASPSTPTVSDAPTSPVASPSPAPTTVPVAAAKPEPKPVPALTLQPVPSFKTTSPSVTQPDSMPKLEVKPSTPPSHNEVDDTPPSPSPKPLDKPALSVEANGFPHTASDAKPVAVFPVAGAPKQDADNHTVTVASQDKTANSPAKKPSDDTTDAREAEPAVPPSPAISRRPAGRFMDVVHPSSVMRGHGIHQPRTGVTLQPTGSYLSGQAHNGQRGVNMSEDDETVSSDMMADDKAPSMYPADREIKRRPPRLVLQPDPSHVAEGLTSDNVSLNTKDVPDYESMASEAEASTDSAFIEEGLLAEDAPAKTPADEGLTMDELTADDDHLVAEAAESQSANDLSAERSDLDAANGVGADRASLEATIDEIEASEVGEQLDATTQPSDSPTGHSADNASELDSELMAIESMDEGEDVTGNEPASRPQAPGDIPQQYAAGKEVAPDPEPMFDAAASQPAAGESALADKKKSGIGTILLIILFALIGVGGGAAAYFFLLYYK